MASTGSNDPIESEVNEVTIFTIPFSSGEIKKSISINTHTAINRFKKENINKAIKLHSEGNILEAEKQYIYLISEGCIDHRVYCNYGKILNDLGKSYEAEIFTLKAIEIKPEFAEAYLNLASILRSLRRLKEAEMSLLKAIEIKSDFAEAHSNLGIILKDLGDLKGAEKSYRNAIKLKPEFSNSYYNLGIIFSIQGNLKEAENYTRKAIQIKPEFAEAYSNLGMILGLIGKEHDAIIQYQKALKLNNNLSSAKLDLIRIKGSICDWSDQDLQSIWIKELGIEGESIYPLDLFCYEDDPLRQLKRAKKLYKNKYFKESKPLVPFVNKKIHIGYFSADFREHPMMFLMGYLFELHDKSKFNIYLYSFVRKEDEYTKIARESGCIFRDIKDLDDAEVVELARNDQLDIAIDRMGYVSGNRMEIFSYRVAKIQIHYLAYPGTLGADCIDYLIADDIIIPKEYEKFYSEKIIRMPHCYQSNDNQRKISNDFISRKSFYLPEKAFVFTCFCANKKITSKEFDIWMQLLKTIKGSVLWLYKSNDLSVQNLIIEAEKRNVDANRLIFANKLPLSNHLARHSLGDLGLDTFNYNGHTTTSDALWAGLPVLTKIGRSFAARVSASILSTIGLPELITYNEKEYEDKALYIASHPEVLIRLKSKLDKAIQTSPLFNSELWTKNLEFKFEELVKSKNL